MHDFRYIYTKNVIYLRFTFTWACILSDKSMYSGISPLMCVMITLTAFLTTIIQIL